jgi:hypothetical protein
MPGKPPPVPISRILVLGLNEKNFAILKECRKCLTSISFMSFLEIKLIFEFQ